MEYRKAVTADLEQIAALEQAVFTDGWSIGGILECLDREYRTLLVAAEADRVFGYLIAYQILNEGEIMRVAVDPGMRRRGLGSGLLKAYFMLGSRIVLDAYSLEVRESNTAARALYKRLGFAEEGRRARYYSDPVEDGLIMWRRESLTGKE